jgi:hypothetical protein
VTAVIADASSGSGVTVAASAMLSHVSMSRRAIEPEASCR